jgi:hypothetical protein
MIPINRQVQYDKFVAEIKEGYQYRTQTKEWEVLFHYLENEDAPMPKYPRTSDTWSFLSLFKMLELPNRWERFDERVLEMMAIFWVSPTHATSYNLSPERFIESWLSRHNPYQIDLHTFQAVGRVLEKYDVSEGFLGLHLLNFNFIFNEENTTPAGLYIVSIIDKILLISPSADHYTIVLLLLKHDEVSLDKYLPQLIISENKERIHGVHHISVLLAHNAPKYEPFLVNVYKKATHKSQAICVLHLLNTHFPEKYNDKIIELSYEYLEAVKKQFKDPNFRFEWHSVGQSKYVVTSIFKYLVDKEESNKLFNTITDFLKDCPIMSVEILDFLASYFQAKSVPILVESINKKDYEYSNTGLTLFKSNGQAILKCLEKLPHESYYPQLWDLIGKADKSLRIQLGKHLAAMQGEEAIPNAEKLLQDKRADVRLVGAMVLSLIKTEKALEILRGMVNTEKNDDARDAMLEGLAGFISAETNLKTIAESVAQAKTRGKLDKPLADWLNTEGSPNLHWTDGSIVDADTLLFIFYRMNRTKDIRFDIEAKPLIEHIDKSKSANFAKFLLKKYFESGADSKFKWCMTLGSTLGGDDELDMLKRKVNEWTEASRGKMAEYAVKALALNGSTKALRAVEFFSRKYKSKNKNIGAAANESFTLVAEELGITPYDLADSIIPDFGFEGLFRVFEVEGETYRAYINNDFKLAFLDEDNKTLKALPKATSNELKEEFKDIAKEIRDIVKSQSSRLEQYLVIQRKWTVAKWDAFFRNNPIMFTYAIRAIWGVFDEKQNLTVTFQCLEDQTLVNIEGDELDLNDLNEENTVEERNPDAFGKGVTVGMVHPMMLNEAQINHWKDTLMDADIQPIFAQLDRPTIFLKDTDKHLKISTEFNKVEYGGYSFVGKMEKLGWSRGSVVDGGGIASYYKDFSELGVTAIIMQVGSLSVGYYEENAELGDLMFVKNKTVSFGSYNYDEPEKSDDIRLIPFGEVPPIVYSEVMADMQFFKENQVKKEEK